MKTHGGKRQGAGRPKGTVVYQDDPKRHVCVRLELSLREKAKKLGDGSITKGIRIAIEQAKL